MFSLSVGFRGVVSGLSNMVTVMNLDGVLVGDMERPIERERNNWYQLFVSE